MICEELAREWSSFQGGGVFDYFKIEIVTRTSTIGGHVLPPCLGAFYEAEINLEVLAQGVQ